MPPTRRTFLQASAAAFVAPAVQARNVNEKLNVGIIGTSGQP